MPIPAPRPPAPRLLETARSAPISKVQNGQWSLETGHLHGGVGGTLDTKRKKTSDVPPTGGSAAWIYDPQALSRPAPLPRPPLHKVVGEGGLHGDTRVGSHGPTRREVRGRRLGQGVGGRGLRTRTGPVHPKEETTRYDSTVPPTRPGTYTDWTVRVPPGGMTYRREECQGRRRTGVGGKVKSDREGATQTAGGRRRRTESERDGTDRRPEIKGPSGTDRERREGRRDEVAGEDGRDREGDRGESLCDPWEGGRDSETGH